MNSTGMTLLELLLATVLLAMLGIALAGWSRLVGRTIVSLHDQAHQLRAQDAAIRLLRSDLAVRSAPWRINEGGTELSVLGLADLHDNMPSPGKVVWTATASGLVRTIHATLPNAPEHPDLRREFVLSSESTRFETGGPGTLWMLETHQGRTNRHLVMHEWNR